MRRWRVEAAALTTSPSSFQARRGAPMASCPNAQCEGYNETGRSDWESIMPRLPSLPCWCSDDGQVAWTAPENTGGSPVLAYRVEWFEAESAREEVQAVRITWEAGDEPYETFR